MKRYSNESDAFRKLLAEKYSVPSTVHKYFIGYRYPISPLTV